MIACNGEIFMWFSNRRRYAFDMKTGIRMNKQALSQDYVACYDHKENQIFSISTGSYGNLSRDKVEGFRSNFSNKKRRHQLPELPNILENHKVMVYSEIQSTKEQLNNQKKDDDEDLEQYRLYDALAKSLSIETS